MKSTKRYLLSLMLLASLFMLTLVGCSGKFPNDNGDHIHTLVEHEAKAPTCVDDGWSKYYTCSECDDYTTFESQAALGHDLSLVSSAEDCTHVRSCTRCSYTVEEAHVWQEGPNTPPACEENGACFYSCAICSKEKTEIITAIGHSYSDKYEYDVDVHTLTCLGCGYILTNSHEWDDGNVKKEPNCTEKGIYIYECTVCGAEKSEDIPAAGNNHVLSEYHSSENDSHIRICELCTYIEYEPHDWNESAILDSDCDNVGIRIYTCSICADKKSVVIDPTGHTYDEVYISNADTHSRVCTVCGAIHSESHTWSEGQIDKAPGCTEEGALVYSCTTCGKDKFEPIDPTGHSYGDTYTQGDDTHSRTCSSCGDVISESHVWQDSIEKEPNCTETGIRIYECTVCGKTKSEIMPTVDQHYDGEWQIIQSPTATVDGYKVLHCAFCNIVIGEQILSADAKTMPTMYMVGDYTSATSAKNEVQMTISYVDPNGQSFDGYALIKVQGASSVKYPKKNYTIKLYKDDQCDKKLKVDLGWGKESKYVMKANWVDFIQARNIVSCRLWGDMVASRRSSALQERLASLSTNGGAIDGYPIAVYMNGEFYGIYTMNVPKDEWMFDMGDSETEAIITADNWSNTDFSALLTEFTENKAGDLVANGGDWELKYYGTEDTTGDTTWVTNSFNRLILFCQQNEGEAFKAGISQYLDIDSAIDYLIHMYVIYMRDNTSKNMIWATYDGQVWFPTVYDQDATFGMVWDGMRYAAANEALPLVTDDGKIDVNFKLGSGNFIFWDRIWNACTEEILARYEELRQTILNESNIIAEFEAFRACIPESVYLADIEKWQAERDAWWGTTSGVWYEKFDYEYTYEWIGNRLDCMDAAMRNIYDNVYLPSVDNPVL